jgi:hypothetical protein
MIPVRVGCGRGAALCRGLAFLPLGRTPCEEAHHGECDGDVAPDRDVTEIALRRSKESPELCSKCHKGRGGEISLALVAPLTFC